MTALSLPFTPSEYAQRLAKTQAEMHARGLDALIVTDPSNQAWLTAYDGWSFYVHQAVIVPAKGAPLWWGRMQDAAGALRTVWMPADRVRGYAEDYIQTGARHPMEDLAQVLGDLGLSNGTIGVEMDNYYYSAKAHSVLSTTLPGATWTDATGLVNWQRVIKSEAEIAFMDKAARISEAVIDRVIDMAEPGIRKNDLVAEMYRDAIRGIGEDWGDYPAIVPLLPSGADAAAPHLTWNGDPLRKGEATTIEIAGCYRRYHAPFCRSIFFGTPPGDMLRAEEAIIEGLNAGIAAAKAGNQARDIAAALNGALQKVGITRTPRCGYPIGLSYPPDWGERTISFRAEDDTVLEPGMCFHFMPGLWMKDWGLSITESIQIMPDGPARTFCDRPRKLFVK